MTEISDWYVRKGEDKDYLFVIKDDNGAVLNVTGWTAKIQVRAHAGAATVLKEWISPASATLNAAGITVAVTRTDSLLWTFDRAYYGVLLTDPSGTDGLVAAGRFIAEPAVVS